MTIELKVTWNNSSSNLISNWSRDTPPEESLVVVAQHQTAMPEIKSLRTKDSRVFVVTDDGDIKVTFHAMMDVVVGARVGLQTVLKVIQRFKCTGGAISASSYDTEREEKGSRVVLAGIPGTHPLVSLPTAQQAKGAAVMIITFDFVDVTNAWLDFIQSPNVPDGRDDRFAWDASPHFETRFCVLACLNGFPKLWFASIPKVCESSAAASALVFFRPAGYNYDVVDDDFSSIFNSRHEFYKIWRFLLAPVCNRSAVSPPPASGTPAPNRTNDARLRDHLDAIAPVAAAIERTLQEAGRPVVVLFPVPDNAAYSSAKQGRSATSSNLAEMADRALASLHARGEVLFDPATRKPFRELKRFGLAAFSMGGDAMWEALRNAVAAAKGGKPNRVREIYVFDANGWSKQQRDPTLLLTSAAQTRDLRLRVSAAHAQGANMDPFPASATLKRSAHPDRAAFPSVYDVAKAIEPHNRSPSNHWYYHYVSAERRRKSDDEWFVKKFIGVPDDQSRDRGARHQFAVFGGEDGANGHTFLRRFLDDSDF